MYRTSNVARLAGAVSLLAFLAGWGLLFLLASGETTVTTWALGFAFMFPISGLLASLAQHRSPPRTGTEYAMGLVASVVTLSVSYIGVVILDYPVVRAVAGFDSLELVSAAVVFALLVGVLAFVDVRYVERPDTAARLEERYLDRPLRSD